MPENAPFRTKQGRVTIKNRYNVVDFPLTKSSRDEFVVKDECMTMIETYSSMIKLGDIRSIAIVAVRVNGQYITSFRNNSLALLGGVTRLSNRLAGTSD